MINEYISKDKEPAKEGAGLFDFHCIYGRNFKNTQGLKWNENHCASTQSDLQKKIIAYEKETKETHDTTFFLVLTEKKK